MSAELPPPPGAPRALMIAAPSSAAGKSVATLALLRAWRRAGRAVAGAKSGPDFLDPTFHAAASGAPSVNLDAWAMDRASLRARAREAAAGRDLMLIEGAMGLLDGAQDAERPEGRGSAADLAEALGAPVVLVLDIAGQGQSAAAVARGFAAMRPDLCIAGVLLNRVGSARHERLARRALEAAGLTVFGALPRSGDLETPSRHLGLVAAQERSDLEAFLDRAGALAEARLDLAALEAAAAPLAPASGQPARLPPPGQRVAIARDAAFSFIYPHLLTDWRAAGAEISFFSPLADEPPAAAADAVFLPGGYPELHAPRLAAAASFRDGLRRAAERGALIYGECGGYMALGRGLTDAEGRRWEMAGLLAHETSFAVRRLHLGYRTLRASGATRGLAAPLFGAGVFLGHEFHYASETRGPACGSLFDASDAEGAALGAIGGVDGRVCGSFTHLIAPGASGGE